MMNKICIISVYFGKFNNYFKLWLKSCAFNKNIDFLIFSDIIYRESHPNNVRFVNITLDELRELSSQKLGVEVQLYRPYKCCDLRPMYGLIFQEYISNYEYWGECDLDLIWGDLFSLMLKYEYYKYDKFLPLGHLSLYRNSERVNNAFRLPGDLKGGWEYVLTTENNHAFDEVSGIGKLLLKNNYSLFYKRVFADISPLIKRFTLSQYCAVDGIYQKNYRYQIFYWENGKVYRDYFKGGKMYTEEFIYIHFRSRPNFVVTEEVYSAESFYITMSGFIPKKGQTTKEIIKRYNTPPVIFSEQVRLIKRDIKCQLRRVKRYITNG